MNIINYIEHLKTKPEHVRKNYAFLISFAISLTIFAGLMASYSLGSIPVLTEGDVKESVAIESPSTSLTASAGNLWKDIKNMFSGSNQLEYTADTMPKDALEITGGSR